MKSNTVVSSAVEMGSCRKRKCRVWRVFGPVLKSRYFLTALGVHLLVLLLWGSRVLVEYFPSQSSFDSSDIFILPPPEPIVRPEEKTQKPQTVRDVPVAIDAGRQIERIAGLSPSDFVNISVPNAAPPLNMPDLKAPNELTKKINAAQLERYARVKEFQKDWITQNSGRQTKAVFTIFKARYQDGDWNCNPSDLENLMMQIRRWSRGRIQANIDPRVLEIGTDELFTIKPPFVYLTGHKDFRLLDTEVRNLREYLMLGGAIWADSALAGRRSRFDIAFRREMKRVFPDRDFEVAGTDHAMFDTFFPNLGGLSGMNFFKEPIEVINIGDELAVVYTLNGYGHYWEAQLNDQSVIEYARINTGTDENPVFRHVHGPHAPRGGGSWWRRTIYRNYDNNQVADAYKLGINITVHLLTRYQQKFRLLPRELPIRGG